MYQLLFSVIFTFQSYNTEKYLITDHLSNHCEDETLAVSPCSGTGSEIVVSGTTFGSTGGGP